MPHIRKCRSSPPRSTGSSTATGTSARGWGMRVTASSEPIAEDERRYRVLVDANVVGVTVSDYERVLEANDAWLRITGHARGAGIGPPELAGHDASGVGEGRRPRHAAARHRRLGGAVREGV